MGQVLYTPFFGQTRCPACRSTNGLQTLKWYWFDWQSDRPMYWSDTLVRLLLKSAYPTDQVLLYYIIWQLGSSWTLTCGCELCTVVCRQLLTHTVAAFCSHSSTWQISCWRRRLPKTHTSTCVVGSRYVKIILIITRNVGQCPTWWPPCRI